MPKNQKVKPNYVKGATQALKRAEQLLPSRQHEPGTPPILIIDGMNIAYQAYYAYSKLSNKGKSTSVLFGFPQIIKAILQMYNPQRVIVCWDGMRHPKRIETVPGYKEHRDEEKSKLVNKQIRKLRQLLHRMGIAQAYNPDIEGDDMIYWVWKRMKVVGKVIIVSGDKDFKQLIDWDTQLYNPRTKYIEGVFAFSGGNYGLEVNQYIDFLSLVGDKSDDIPGLRGIGEVRAASFLQKFYSISNYLEMEVDYPGFVDRDKLIEVRKQNRIMIDLAYFNQNYNKVKNILYFRGEQRPKFNDEKFRTICINHNLSTMLFPKFIEAFKKLHDE